MIESLQSLAEVAIALTGFSGIVIALLSSRTDIRAYQLELGAITVPSASFFVVLLALLPVGLAGLGWQDDMMWRLCSFLLAGVFLFITWPAIYLFQKNSSQEKVPSGFMKGSLSLHALIVATQLCNGLALFNLPFEGLYFFGLLIYFLQYFFTFVWLLGNVGRLLIGRGADVAD